MDARPPAVPLRHRTTFVWLALVAATTLSWWLGTHSLGFRDPRSVGVVVLAIGFVKSRYVALDFMELRDAPIALRAIMELWLAGAFALLAALFLSA